MEASKHNIISEVKDSDKYFIVNLLAQEADIISKKEAFELMNNKEIFNEEYLKKGYVVDPVEERKKFRKKYLEFIDARDSDEIQLFFVPSYACNFTCSYCYQDEYENIKQELSYDILDSFFKYITNHFNGRKKYITVFGGEPLLSSDDHKKYIKTLLDKSRQNKIDVAFVTNGYNLSEYVPLFTGENIREVQVTIDGTAEVHNKRRKLKNGQETFNKIVEGIDYALEKNIPINLRMVIDKDNIKELPKLASFAIKKGWTNNSLFKTQLGRNYELHHCQINASRLYSRIEMYRDIYCLLKDFPFISEFHKPAFSIAKFLFEEGNLPDPLFDSCPGTKTEWAFDYTGKIFSCTAMVGKQGEELGSFYPKIVHNTDAIEEWEDRDVLTIEKCHDCELQLACGGGCASVAKNVFGSVKMADCRPIKELLELGISHYFHP